MKVFSDEVPLTLKSLVAIVTIIVSINTAFDLKTVMGSTNSISNKDLQKNVDRVTNVIIPTMQNDISILKQETGVLQSQTSYNTKQFVQINQQINRLSDKMDAIYALLLKEDKK